MRGLYLLFNHRLEPKEPQKSGGDMSVILRERCHYGEDDSPHVWGQWVDLRGSYWKVGPKVFERVCLSCSQIERTKLEEASDV